MLLDFLFFFLVLRREAAQQEEAKKGVIHVQSAITSICIFVICLLRIFFLPASALSNLVLNIIGFNNMLCDGD